MPTYFNRIVALVFILLTLFQGTQKVPPTLADSIQKEIFEAIKASDVVKLKTMLDGGLDPNALILGGTVPMLASASHGGKTEVVRLLLQFKANANLATSGFYRIPPLHSAAEEGHPEIVSMLLKAGADPAARTTTRDGKDEREGYTALISTITERNSNIEVIKQLIQASDVNLSAPDGTPPISYAAFNGKHEIVQLLIGAGADVNRANDRTMTPLMFASIRKDNTAVIKQLLAAKVDVNARSQNGNNALMTAAINGATDAVGLLVEAKAEVNAKDNEGHTALMSAARVDLQMANVLLVAGADVNVVSSPPSEVSALSMAVLANRPDIVKRLIEAGANVNRAVAGETPLDIAEKNQSTEIIAILKKAGAKLVCPIVEVTGPTKLLTVGSKLVFKASVRGGDPSVSPVYNWTVSAGVINKGQGTRVVDIDTKAGVLQGAKTITATVAIVGYDRSCSTSRSYTVEFK